MANLSVDRDHLKVLITRESADFEERHPKSRELFKKAGDGLLGGVPMSWMKAWQTRCPIFVEHAAGSRVTDVDGHEYVDFFYGITAAMFGHAVPAVVDAVTERVRNGTTFMLPTEDSVWVAHELKRRFGLPSWQVALTSTDACRFVIRMARALTMRPKVLVFDGCYHGHADAMLMSCFNARLSSAATMSRTAPRALESLVRVKICGITRLTDAELAADLGAAMVGFVFWPGSPRFIDPYRALRIAPPRARRSHIDVITLVPNTLRVQRQPEISWDIPRLWHPTPLAHRRSILRHPPRKSVEN